MYSESEIDHWLVEQLAAAVNTKIERIDKQCPFENFGLNSVELVGLCAELSDWIGYEINPIVVYQYNTVEELSTYLAAEGFDR